ncbi:MAG: DNA polymerase, partial [Microcystaceae cyanobacterium]
MSGNLPISNDPISEKVPLCILIDGHSLAFRSYYAFTTSNRGPLRTSTGIPTSICFGFLNSLIKVIESQKPQFIAVAFDRREPTFRHEADANYKANRLETPEDFIPDLENLQDLLLALNLQVVTALGYEADDVLGTLAKTASEAGCTVKILSGDRDLFQLVDREKKISVLYLDSYAIKNLSNSVYAEFDPLAVEEKLGIKPTQVVDYKALCGDKSDNIPGVRGIGDKTAVKLLKEYGTLEEIYQNLEQIQGSVKKKLEVGKKEAEHSKHLAQLVLDVPVKIELEDCRLQGFDTQRLNPLLEKLELKTLIKKVDQLQQQRKGTVVKTLQQKTINSEIHEPQQLSLFSEPKPITETSSEIIQPSNIPVPILPIIVDTSAQLLELIDLLKNYTDSSQPVAWDTETTALDPLDAELVGIGCCWGSKPTNVAYIPTYHTEGNYLDKQEVISALRPILESSNYPKVFQNTKFDRIVLWKQGINLAGIVFDTMLASYVLHPEKSHKLSDLCDRYLTGITSKDYKDLGIPKGKTLADLDIKTVADYCGMDAYATFELVAKLSAELKEIPELYKLLLEVEQPLEPVLADMEKCGIRIDTIYLKEFSQQLEQDLNMIQQQIYQDAGEIFNLDSPKQLGDILFEKLGLSRKKSRKNKTGYSTD